MSRRYSTKRVCPGCGLLVAATDAGQLRSHVRLAVAADVDAECARAPVNTSRRDNEAPRRVAEQYVEQTDVRLASHRRSMLDPDSQLPRHLR